MPSLSVILITKNEAANIRDCLQSVAWADEIIVVDSASSDDTADIARAMGAQVYVHADWPGFGPQKNRALGYASKDWVFSIDADERVTPELRAELEQAMRTGNAEGYYCPRLSQFCGKFVHHSGWYPDYVLRLFKRGTGRFSDSLVHESVLMDGAAAKLKSPLLHYSYLTTADVERKVEHYSNAAAQQMLQAGKRSSWVGAMLSGGWAFVRTYIIRLGILDGAAGWSIALMNARTTYLKYRKLAVLNSTRISH
ncbi:glycosyltransferase family 2 protein [Sideroxydans lithotrophicus]|uniref:Glycosyl transferase family 2 n=1 Tax=Sideroxydans lithotrophicus (strain ES-1) TaxID=580332 RepID=D5CQ83_SIDLE|nr:glycosyltransferase family 2 protein [Sideroxydans lithotrophicus]ADE13104.1 glycosyl transferase family 2 [Sideroxydans lithotrophicus ES-1]